MSGVLPQTGRPQADQRGADELAEALRAVAGPRPPVAPEEIEIAYRQPPLPDGRVGGCWFDVFALPDGRTALLVGEVTGKGPEAEVRMSQCRAIVQALVSLDLEPRRLLGHLGALVKDVNCVYVLYEPVERQCRIAWLGRVPVALVHPLSGRVTAVRDVSGFGAPDGCVLALCTDGLVVDGETLAGRLGDDEVEPLCDRMLGEGVRRDGFVLLLARLSSSRLSLPGLSPPGRSLSASDVPLRETGFVGRESEAAELRYLLRASRLVTMTGPGGVGKSRLAEQAAEALRGDFPDGIRFVPLAGIREPDQLPVAVGNALASLGSLVELHDRRMLLVLDGCEHLTEACAGFARSLLRAAPEVRVLAVSRQPLGVTGEHILNVVPLPVDDAVRLLADRTGVVFDSMEHSTVRKVCETLDCLPLAIELAAARLRQAGGDPRAWLRELGNRPVDRFRLLTSARSVSPSHHRSLYATVGRSHDLCLPPERLLWSRLSAFRGPFDLAAAESSCADEALPRHEVLHVLSGLVRKSVVLRDPEGSYRLLESFRAYALAHLR